MVTSPLRHTPRPRHTAGIGHTLRRILGLAVVIIAALPAAAFTDTMTGIFDPSFRTLQTYVEGDPLSYPVIVADTSDRLIVAFDELAEDRRYLRYNITHCDSRWQPEGLVDSEILDGFNESEVRDYEYSRGTTTHYVHYTITIPNDDMRPLLSGNYLLRVYDESDPDVTLLQTRFMVVEPRVSIDARYSGVTDIDYNDSHQQLSIAVDTRDAGIRDPFNDLRVVITQDGRGDNETAVTHPQRVVGSQLIYEHLPQLIFEAGNEYRRAETVSVTYPGMHVAEIRYVHPYYHFTLDTDYPRAGGRYEYDETQDGAFVVREYNSDASDIEADYGIVHFALESPRLANTDIYLDGDIVHRRFDDTSRMVYNDETGCYEKVLLLKQGAFNYRYLAVRPGDRHGRTSVIEGDHFQTSNRYMIRVYERRPGERYDRLIGVTVIR